MMKCAAEGVDLVLRIVLEMIKQYHVRGMSTVLNINRTDPVLVPEPRAERLEHRSCRLCDFFHAKFLKSVIYYQY